MQFSPDKTTYIRSHAWMAALAIAAAMALLWIVGNDDIWIGAVGGLAAIALRGWYMASEEMAVVWTLKDGQLTGPQGRIIATSQIEKLRTVFGAVQVITTTGDKHLIKYQADPAAVISALERAR